MGGNEISRSCGRERFVVVFVVPCAVWDAPLDLAVREEARGGVTATRGGVTCTARARVPGRP